MSSRILTALALSALIAAEAPAKSPAKSPARSPKPFVRGMALGSYSGIRQAKLEEKLSELGALGVSHVSLVVSWSTRDVRSTTIAPRERYTTPDPLLAQMIRRVHAHGMKVFLFPILDVRKRKPLEWRGTLKPADWDAWWRSYQQFILHFARIAARHRVEMFCVGSELVTTEKMRDRWASVIAKVRQVYRGKLVYSANWDHYEPVVFWDLVDIIGLTAYYKLTQNKQAPEAEMLEAWRRIRRKLVPWARRQKKSFIFTEVGYPSMDGCAVHPWDYTLSAPVDLEEQRRAFAAFVKAWDRAPALSGVVFWDWYGPGGERDTRYTPRGKPAARVIHKWFHRLAKK